MYKLEPHRLPVAAETALRMIWEDALEEANGGARSRWRGKAENEFPAARHEARRNAALAAAAAEGAAIGQAAASSWTMNRQYARMVDSLNLQPAGHAGSSQRSRSRNPSPGRRRHGCSQSSSGSSRGGDRRWKKSQHRKH